MKTLDYVKKYKLNVSDKFDHSEFVQDLASDFIALLELNKANDNIKGFENALRCVRMKFDSISNKTIGQLTEKLWGYFFATVVVKLRNEMCPREQAKRDSQREARNKEWEQRKKQREWEDKELSGSYFNNFNFFSFLFAFSKTPIPSDSFVKLGLSESATEQEVKSSYKQLSLKHHPDKGGKQDDFIDITNAKNKCLSYLEQK